MSFSNQIDSVSKLIEPAIAVHGYVLVEVHFGQIGKKRTVEIAIFHPDKHISLDDCQNVSRIVDEILEKQDPPIIDGPFMLEVQSPGIDRKLKTDKELRLFTGQEVEVKTREPINSLGDSFHGQLLESSTTAVKIGNPIPIMPKSKAGKNKTKDHGVLTDINIERGQLIRIQLYPLNLSTSSN